MIRWPLRMVAHILIASASNPGDILPRPQAPPPPGIRPLLGQNGKPVPQGGYVQRAGYAAHTVPANIAAGRTAAPAFQPPLPLHHIGAARFTAAPHSPASYIWLCSMVDSTAMAIPSSPVWLPSPSFDARFCRRFFWGWARLPPPRCFHRRGLFLGGSRCGCRAFFLAGRFDVLFHLL